MPSRWLHDSPTYTCCGLSHWSRSAHVLNGSRPRHEPAVARSRSGCGLTWSSATTRTPLWAAAESLIAHADPHVVQQRQAIMVGTPMVGQQAQARRVAQHRIGAHLWNGLSTVRVNCGTAIVGTPQEVTEELLAYWRLGIDEFILSAPPGGGIRVHQEILPRLRAAVAAAPLH